MKNTFTTPSAQQFGLWFQVLTSWEKLYKAGYWEDVNTSDSRNQVTCHGMLYATVCNRVENITYAKRKKNYIQMSPKMAKDQWEKNKKL